MPGQPTAGLEQSSLFRLLLTERSRPPSALPANELGVYDSTLGNWVRQDEINRGEREGLRSGERERLRELERENARLRMERELVETSCGLLGAGVERMTLYRFVDDQKAEGFPVRLTCSGCHPPRTTPTSSDPSLVLP